MAAAEARAAWQRAANRCIIQEDTKIAPKLPCCSSSQNHDKGNYENAPPTDHHQIPNFTPSNWNPVGPTNHLPSETKWWLQLQPNFGYQREFLYYDQLNLLHGEFNEKKDVQSESIICGTNESVCFDDINNGDMWMVSTSYMKHTNYEIDKQLKYEAKCYEDPLINKKNEPWWRVADEKELASMVAQKGGENIENCDLPRPAMQTLHYDFGGGVGRNYCDDDGLLVLPALSKVVFPEFSDVCGEEKDKYFRRTESDNSNKSNTLERNRAELLEALCHSQTRAREAEIAAKKANNEKEDIIKLLFRQASHLFACKQWLKLLQLENMCLQLRLRDQRNVGFGEKREKEKDGFERRREKGRKMCRYMVVFALAGAGLLFGWTLGWLLPKL